MNTSLFGTCVVARALGADSDRVVLWSRLSGYQMTDIYLCLSCRDDIYCSLMFLWNLQDKQAGKGNIEILPEIMWIRLDEIKKTFGVWGFFFLCCCCWFGLFGCFLF